MIDELQRKSRRMTEVVLFLKARGAQNYARAIADYSEAVRLYPTLAQ